MNQDSGKWMEQAYRDIEYAKMNYEMKAYYVSAFLSQQAGEKALKALHISMYKRFPRVHDLTKLARAVGAPNEIIEVCASLTPAYTATRYPDVYSDIEEDEAYELIGLAKEVIEWVEERI